MAASRDAPARLLTLGRLVERKGVDTAIDALARLPGAELVVAGGPDRDRARRRPRVPAGCGTSPRPTGWPTG